MRIYLMLRPLGNTNCPFVCRRPSADKSTFGPSDVYQDRDMSHQGVKDALAITKKLQNVIYYTNFLSLNFAKINLASKQLNDLIQYLFFIRLGSTVIACSSFSCALIRNKFVGASRQLEILPLIATKHDYLLSNFVICIFYVLLILFILYRIIIE